MRQFLMIALASIFTISNQCYAQQTIRLNPKSFNSVNKLNSGLIPTTSLPALDLNRIKAADKDAPGSRFAAPIQADLSWEDGMWRLLANGDRIWQLKISSEKALGLALFYDQFYLPPGSTLHLYDEAQSIVLGAYTSQNNPANQKFLMGFIPGETAILEYYEPKAVKDQGRLHIFRVDYAYDKDQFQSALRNSQLQMEFGFGTSLNCHANINCPDFDGLQTLKRGICRILLVVEEGTGFCTGNLINNVRKDDTPYILSAFHCQDGFTPLYDFWRFDFHYESDDCGNPLEEPSFNSLLGATLRAGRQENDFLLLEISNPIPSSFDPHFLGWNRSTSVPTSASMIHQPKGDIKKAATIGELGISVFSGTINWNNDVTTPANHHFEVNIDNGNFEIGSSGAALFNQNQHVVGQLHGGNAECDDAQAWYGRLAFSWEGGGTAATRLKDWLDPDDSQAMWIDGNNLQNSSGSSITGMVLTDAGDPIPNVQLQLVGNEGISLMTTTDNQGAYSFEGLEPDTYQISPSKMDDAQNGLSVLDLIQSKKHILNIEPFASPYQILAADVNGSNSVSTLDLIITQKVILGLDIAFENLASWTFLPADSEFVNDSDPFLGLNGASFSITIFENAVGPINYDIIGIKTGDVNNSANLD